MELDLMSIHIAVVAKAEYFVLYLMHTFVVEKSFNCSLLLCECSVNQVLEV